MSSYSEEEWYNEDWISEQLNWGKSPNKVKKSDNFLSQSKSHVEKANSDVVNSPVTIDLSSGDEGESEMEEEIKVVFVRESHKINRFPLLPSDNFESLFEAIAKFKNVPKNRIELVMMPNARDVSPYDSLTSLNYSVCNYFYAYVTDGSRVSDSNGTGNIEIICVAPNKDKLVYKMEDKQPFDVLLSYCARDLKIERHKFKLILDGETVKPTDTCSSLDITDQDLIEIHFNN